MKLASFLENRISMYSETADAVKPMAKKKALAFLKENKINASNELGVNLAMNLANIKAIAKSFTEIPKEQRAKEVGITKNIIDSSAPVYKLITNNDEVIYIKNTTSIGQKNTRGVDPVTSPKELTPDKMGFAGKKISRSDLIELIRNHKWKNGQENVKVVVDSVLDRISKIRNVVSDVTYEVPGLKEALASIANNDEGNIFKDLGECFSAIVSSGDKSELLFPSESNYPLIDFIIENGDEKMSYSAKYKQGAAPSLSGLSTIMKKNKKILLDDPAEKAMMEILEAITNNSQEVGIEKLSKILKLEKRAQTTLKAYMLSKEGSDIKEGTRAYEIALSYNRMQAVKNYLNNESLNGKKITDIFSSLMNAAFSVDQVVILAVKDSKIQFKYYPFPDAKFAFRHSNAPRKIVSKLAFEMRTSKSKSRS